MIYCETIKSSKTYTPPKSGIYKIICIGGGGAGYVYDTPSAITSSEAGGTTSFGSYVAASGGASGKNVVMLGGTTVVDIRLNGGIVDSGKNGFNGACEYGASSGMAVGYGYGASGAAYGINSKKYSSGQAGDVVSTIVELDPSASIACTIGAGGKGGFAGNYNYAWSGADGAIIVQYLGESL